MIQTIIEFLTVILELLKINKFSDIIRFILQSILNFIIFGLMYVIMQSIVLNSFQKGFETIFHPQSIIWNGQKELELDSKSTILTNHFMENILDLSETSSRVRLGIIHNGTAGLNGIKFLHFDIISAIAKPGRNPGPLLTNESLTKWISFMPTILNNKCALIDVNSLSSHTVSTSLNMKFMIGCPIKDIEGETLGVVFLSWDNGDIIPSESEINNDIIPKIQEITSQIAIALDLRKID